MNNVVITLLLVLLDAVGTALAWRLSFLLRFESGMFTNAMPVALVGPMAVLTAFWLTTFALRGMYRAPIAVSRFEEFEKVFKAVLIGVVLLYVATFDIARPLPPTRLFLAYYGLLVLLFVALERSLLRTYQRRQRRQRKGLWDAVIVGFNDVGRKLYRQLYHFPVWGFNVVGFVDDEAAVGEQFGLPVLGKVADLPDIARERQLQWVLVAPVREASEVVADVLDRCESLRLRYMLVADHYQMVIGLVRTVEIHGLPLIEVHPQLVPLPTRFFKRLTDIVFGLVMSFGLAIVSPLIALAIKLDTPGSVFYSQRRIGRRGREFTLVKFRSMVADAESRSGAVWAQRNDPRVTRVGRFLRSTHLDEMPQFFNVLVGQMSLVGPRPERREFVEDLKKRVPLYERRQRVRPGITGWAQVRHKYDETIEDVVEKNRYDLFYIDHISIGLDLKILLSTVIQVLRGGGH